MLAVLDNLQRALRHTQEAGGTNGLVQGVELTCKQYVEILSRYGVKEIPSVGLPFDPAVHQAVALVDAEEGQAANTIVAEHEKGYYLYDRVLRPAMVTVVAPNKPDGQGDVPQSSS
jgi:molecular chaperone GrpE